MKKLIAKFDIELPFFLLINLPAPDDLKFSTTIDDYSVIVMLIRDELWRSVFKDEREWSKGITKIQVSVAKDEEVEPPPPDFLTEGLLDHEDRHSYFDKRRPEFQRIAHEALNRIIRYFKYQLYNPLVYELSIYEGGLLNPEWTDETGVELKDYSTHMVLSPNPGLGEYKLSARKLSAADYPDLQAALNSITKPELFEEFLSDAQTAFFERNLHWSVLEMAIACELFVKSFFFGKSNLSSTTFDYYEDKGRISFRVIDLIDNVAKRAFGVSFKEENCTDFRNIDYLFRARNKIAHRGKILFRDDSGKSFEVSEEIIEEWWNSTQKLILWLKHLETPEEFTST